MGLRNSNSESEKDLEIVLGEQSTRIRVVDSGPREGLALVFLHGWGSSSHLMRSLSGPLSAEFRSISIDFPGHGKSPNPPSALGVPEHVSLVREVLNQCEVTHFALIGHSNGGRVSLQLASESGQDLRPAFLALVSPSGIRRKRSWNYYVKVWAARILKTPFNVLPPRAKEFGLDWLRHSLVWRLLGSSDYRALSGVMRETFVHTVNHYVTDRLSHVSCPVLVYWGSSDDAINRQQMDELTKALPDGGLFVLEGAGHFSHLNQPDVIINGVRTLAKTMSP